METDEICSPPEHSTRFAGGLRGAALPADESFSQKRSQLGVFERVFGDAPMGPCRARRNATRKIEMALTHMLQNLDKPIPMSALSTLAGISLSNFYHLFKLTTGFTPNDFLIRARMRRACELLQGTDRSVKEVAAALGYNDPFYFSRAFKSVMSVSPQKYRVIMADSEYAPRRTALEAVERGICESLAPFPSEPRGDQRPHALTGCHVREKRFVHKQEPTEQPTKHPNNPTTQQNQ